MYKRQGMVVAYSTMPVKNNVTIYSDIYLNSLETYGLWDQVVTDHGREFYLVHSAQDYLQSYRTNTSRAPYLQVTSQKVKITLA